MAPTYTIAETPLPDGTSKLTWSVDGEYDPLNFWYVASCDVEEAKRIIRDGEIETHDGSTIPTTVRRCQRWLAAEA